MGGFSQKRVVFHLKGESSGGKILFTQFTSSTAITSTTVGKAEPTAGEEVEGIPGQGERQPTATQYSTYSDVRPNVGGGDYGAPRRPVRCESLNQ